MIRNRIYLSTIDPNAQTLCRQYGFGLEIAEYCTAWNLDDKYLETNSVVKEKIKEIPKRLFHAPFSELFPCAIDPKARAMAESRYRQAIELAKSYGAIKVVIHGGYNPWIYYPEWYVEQSILFWKEFLKEDPEIEIVLENVLETQPDWLLCIIKGVEDPRLRMCLDIGHVNAYSPVSVMEWLEACAPFISHFHIHNNYGTRDQHNALDEGTIPIKEFLLRAEELCPDATVTLELMEAESSVSWLLEG